MEERMYYQLSSWLAISTKLSWTPGMNPRKLSYGLVYDVMDLTQEWAQRQAPGTQWNIGNHCFGEIDS